MFQVGYFHFSIIKFKTCISFHQLTNSIYYELFEFHFTRKRTKVDTWSASLTHRDPESRSEPRTEHALHQATLPPSISLTLPL